MTTQLSWQSTALEDLTDAHPPQQSSGFLSPQILFLVLGSRVHGFTDPFCVYCLYPCLPPVRPDHLFYNQRGLCYSISNLTLGKHYFQISFATFRLHNNQCMNPGMLLWRGGSSELVSFQYTNGIFQKWSCLATADFSSAYVRNI